ncbi:MAG: serine hydrolase domain-containing protein [Ilumatobacteraceae bacterium]
MELCSPQRDGDRSTGIAWALARDGDLVETGSSGFKVPAPAVRAPFLLGSVTKPIVATAALRLAQRGVIDLDDRLTRWLPPSLFAQAHGSPSTPTLAEVLAHVGGFGAHHDFTYGATARHPDVMIDRYGVRFNAPGSRFEYSNLGYAAVGRVLEAAAGIPLGELLSSEVASPLGLSTLAFGPAEPPGAAKRYAASGAEYPLYDTSHAAASLAWASAPDLALFGQAHTARHPYLAPAMRARGHASSAATANDSVGYATGWATRTIDGITVLVHGGSMGGVSAGLIVVPALGLSAAAVVNVTDRNGAVDDVLNRLLVAEWPRYAPIEDAPRPSDRTLVGYWTGERDTGGEAPDHAPNRRQRPCRGCDRRGRGGRTLPV